MPTLMMKQPTRLPKIRRPLLILAASLVALILLAGVVWGATLAGFNTHWHSISAGGGQATGGGYTLRASIGQPLTGEAGEAGDGGIRLQAGFPSAFVSVPPYPTPAYWVYLPIGMR